MELSPDHSGGPNDSSRNNGQRRQSAGGGPFPGVKPRQQCLDIPRHISRNITIGDDPESVHDFLSQQIAPLKCKYMEYVSMNSHHRRYAMLGRD